MSNTPARSWVDEDASTTNRGAMLAMLAAFLCASIAIFIYLVWHSRDQKTWLAAVSVTNYGRPIPEASAWDSQSLVTAAQENEVRPWAVVDAGQERIENDVNLLSHLEEVIHSPALSSDENETQHVLVVLLRCHAAVTAAESNADPENLTADDFVCELVIRESAATKCRLSEVFDILAGYGSADVLLLADVCDLDYLPAKGWLFNPVVSWIRRAAEKADKLKQRDTRVWVVSAADDGQRTCIDRNGKTLFQTACQESLYLDSDSENLTLVDYYDRVARHCLAGSAGQQSPRLILANSPQTEVLPGTELWRAAAAVQLGWKDYRELEEIPEDAKATAPPAAAGFLPPLALLQRSNETSEAQAQAAPAVPGEAATTSTDRQPADENSAATSVDSFWKRTEQLGRQSPQWQWKPAELHPFGWRLLQATSAASGEDRRMLRQLDTLLSQRPGGEDWPGRVWENPNLLPLDERSRWVALRGQYRTYIDAVTELTFWRDLAFRFPERFASPLDQTIELLLRARREIPEDPRQSALRSRGLGLESAQPTSVLQTALSEAIESLLTAEAWGWRQESDCREYLLCPLLTASDRERLSSYRDAQNVRAVVPSNENLRSMILAASQTSNRIEAVKRFARWAEHFEKFYIDHDSTPTASIAIEPRDELSALRYQTAYLQQQEQLARSLEQWPPVRQWHFLALAELYGPLSNEIDRPNDGIVLYPSDQSAIELYAKSPIDIQGGSVQLVVSVAAARSPTAPLPRCRMRWSLLDSAGQARQGDVLRLTVGGRPWPQSEPKIFSEADGTLRNKTVTIECRLTGGIVGTEIGRLRLETVEDSGATMRSIALPVYRDREQIDLLISGEGSGTAAPAAAEAYLLPSPQGPNEYRLPSVAMADVKNGFRLSLRNKKPEPRLALMKIIAADRSPDDGSGRVLATTKPQLLAAATDEGPIDQSVFLEWIGGKQESAPFDKSQSLFFRVEEYPPPEDNVAPAQPPQSAPKRVYVFRGRVDTIHPNRIMTAAFPEDTPEGRRLWLQLDTGSFFDLYPRAEVPLSIAMLEPPGGQVKDKLDAGRRQTRLELAPYRPDTQFLFAVDIAGYPRARFFSIRRNGGQMYEDPSVARISDVSLLPPEGIDPPIELLQRPLPGGESDERQYVFPTWRGDLKLLWSNVQLAGTVDAPTGQGIEYRLAADGQPDLTGQWDDRRVTHHLTLDGDLIMLQTSVSEFSQTLDLSRLDDSHSVQLELELRAGQAAVKRFSLLFDRDSPRKGELLGDQGARSVTLYEDDRAEFAIDVSDDPGGSGVVGGQLSVVSEAQDRGKFDETAVQAPWEGTLQGSGEARSLRFRFDPDTRAAWPSGTYIARVRTVDAAGNRQDDNYGLRILIKSGLRPKPASPPADQ